ncbi:MAG TPA: DUF5684 domain-containing protein [Chloroflexota bacterium]|nr:DUF5684 domain-containing protein [Chloroflexota bacterium]
MGTILWLVYLVVVVLEIAATWQLFVKAGESGWKSLIPIWNTLVLLRMAGRPGWWFILYLIPIVNVVIHFIVMIDLARNYGKGTGFGVLLALFPYIMIPIMAFGSAQYARTAVPA